jgi:glycosyltransferase involved in cell wall biosynthesis
MVVVQNGCDWDESRGSDDVVEPEISQFCEAKFVIGLVARFTRRKHIERLVRGFKLFLDRGDGVLLLVGDGEEMGAIRRLITTHCLTDKVRLIGLRPQPRKYYEMMDVCVFPAEGEGFGLVALEAYHTGKPVIIFSDGGGLLEIIRPFEPTDIVDSEECLANRLWEYYVRRDHIHEGAARRREYAQQFSVERMAEAYEELYRKAVGGRLQGVPDATQRVASEIGHS